jgi:MFS family permease
VTEERRRGIGRLGAALRAIAVDTSALRDSRDFRLLTIGGFISGLGTQVTLVALPYQVYVLTRSSFQVGLIGLAELLPLIAVSLVGGSLADRMDRRRLLQISQVAQLAVSAALVVVTVTGPPPVGVLYALAGLAAAGAAIDRPTRTAMLPNMVGPERLRPALAFTYGLYQLTMVVGPALGGVVIAVIGLSWAYGLDVATFVAMIVSVALISPQPLPGGEEHEPVLAAIREGLAFTWSKGELMGSFAIDIMAMTFGMPRALFPALALTVYGAGPAAGAADSVSAVCRSTILQTVTPDPVRGRLSAIYSLVVAGGPRIGDVESGTVAAAFGTQASVVSGGLLCLLGIVPIVAAFPEFWRYGDGDGGSAEPVLTG